MMRFLTRKNVVAFFLAQPGLLFRMFIEDQPANRPNHTEDAGDDKCHFPAVGDDGPDHQRRRDHSADRGADVEIAHGDGTLFRREPLAAGFQAGRDHRGFRRADRAARNRQAAPAARQRGGGAEDRPKDGEHRIANFGAENIKNITRDRLHDGIAGRVSGDDIGVLLGGNVKLILERRRGNGNGVARQVTQHGTDGHQTDHIPA